MVFVLAALAMPAQAKNECPDSAEGRVLQYRAGPDCWPPFKVDESIDAVPLGTLPEPVESAVGTKEQQALGKLLFFDPRLSGSGQIACASCHDPEWQWADGRRVPYGHNRKPGRRNSPSIANAALQHFQFWDGRAAGIPAQVLMPIANQDEMHSTPAEAVEKINQAPGYGAPVMAAFGKRNLDQEGLTKALTAFLGAVTTTETRFDHFYRGEGNALTDQEIRGLDLFRTKAGCMNCHHGPLFSDNKFHNIGLHYYGRKYEDLGRYQVTRKESDVGGFKTPGLRNVSKTGPWMHNGLFPSLGGIVNIYNVGGARPRPRPAEEGKPPFPSISPLLKPLDLTTDEKAALVAFLKSLDNIRGPFFRPPVLPDFEE